MYRDCEKIAYDTYAAASQALSLIKSKTKPVYRNGRKIKSAGHKVPKRAYKCERCGKYHLTSMK